MCKEPFLCYQTKMIFIGKSRLFKLTEESGANDHVGCNGKTLLVNITNPDRSLSEYVLLFGL